MLTPALSSALSGLNAQKLRLNATASNVANVSSGGAVPGSAEAAAGAPTVYRPLRVDMSSQILANGQGAGVSANVTEIQDGFSLVYDPDAVGANAEGFVGVPNVDLAAEAVNLIETKLLFKANAAVIRAQDDMTGQLLDVFE